MSQKEVILVWSERLRIVKGGLRRLQYPGGSPYCGEGLRYKISIMSTFKSLTRAERSALMARVRKTDTKPELAVRKLTHAMGYRFRLYRRDLPGTPDLTFPSRKKVIYVHGCFWHQHDCRAGAKQPSTNVHYWLPKLEKNQKRDAENLIKLRQMGWRALVIWECEVPNLRMLQRRIKGFLER